MSRSGIAPSGILLLFLARRPALMGRFAARLGRTPFFPSASREISAILVGRDIMRAAFFIAETRFYSLYLRDVIDDGLPRRCAPGFDKTFFLARQRKCRPRGERFVRTSFRCAYAREDAAPKMPSKPREKMLPLLLGDRASIFAAVDAFFDIDFLLYSATPLEILKNVKRAEHTPRPQVIDLMCRRAPPARKIPDLARLLLSCAWARCARSPFDKID